MNHAATVSARVNGSPVLFRACVSAKYLVTDVHYFFIVVAAGVDRLDDRLPADGDEDGDNGYDYRENEYEEDAVISDSSEETASTTSTTTKRPFAVRPYQEAVATTQKSVTSVMGT